jgi:hypothetical protein
MNFFEMINRSQKFTFINIEVTREQN